MTAPAQPKTWPNTLRPIPARASNGGRNTENDSEDGVLLAVRPKVKRPPMFHVMLHNDDYTTQELVIEILRLFFHRTDAAARHIMLTVHHKGKGVAGTYARDLAESKVAQVTDFARAHGAPLKLTAEPADD
jgi:ATP-dependent Clp protease adaptor protein ClpS